MIAVDTNVLVRFLVQDDPVQSARAHQLIAQQVSANVGIFVPVTVALELEWVLRARYRFAKQRITDTFSALLSTTELVFESEYAIELALHYAKQYGGDFADCLHAALAQQAGHVPLYTFDQKASGLPNAVLL